MAHMVKSLPAMWKVWVQEDPLEKCMATYSSILAWRIRWTEETGGLRSMGSQRVRHSWSNLAQHTHTFSIREQELDVKWFRDNQSRTLSHHFKSSSFIWSSQLCPALFPRQLDDQLPQPAPSWLTVKKKKKITQEMAEEPRCKMLVLCLISWIFALEILGPQTIHPSTDKRIEMRRERSPLQGTSWQTHRCLPCSGGKN